MKTHKSITAKESLLESLAKAGKCYRESADSADVQVLFVPTPPETFVREAKKVYASFKHGHYSYMNLCFSDVALAVEKIESGSIIVVYKPR